MYTFSPKLKTAAIVFMILGIIMFAVGYGLNHANGEEFVKQQMAEHPEDFSYLDSQKEAHAEVAVVEEAHAGHGEHGEAATEGVIVEEHGSHGNHTVEHLLAQYHNKPWTAFFMSAFLFTGIAAVSMFFLAIQHLAQAGWSVIVTRVMEAITVFLPYGTVLMLIVLVGSALHYNHLYHWMDKSLVDYASPNFDHFMKTKEAWLNVPSWMGRSVAYLVGWCFFSFMLRKKSKKLDETGDTKDYWRLYKWAVFAIIFFALSSMASGWDWVMSIDPHWYSTLFGWYVMASYLVSAVAVMILISIHLKKQGALPEFNDNHLHDLTKYLFGFSLLWGYLWLCQFELIWYANIPEESVYFQLREALYDPTYYKMLIINVVLPFLILISSSIKRNYTVVSIMAGVIILGHWLDIFNQMMPTTVGPWWQFGLLEFGALFFVGGLFTFVVMSALTKMKLIPKGNPLLHESEIYEYPF